MSQETRKEVVFKQDYQYGEWISRRSGVELCDSEIQQWLDLPEGTRKIFAVFTKRKPRGNDHFVITDTNQDRNGNGRITFDTRDEIGFMGDALALLNRMHKAGLHYVSVEY